MKISRRFTHAGQDSLVGLTFAPRTVVDPSTRKSFEFTAPTSWSDTAVEILATKYRFASRETDARQMFQRLSRAWTEWGKRLGYFDSADDAQAFCDEITYLIGHQCASPNSPQWFNTGLHEAYGLKGDPQGHWYAEENGAVRPSPDAYSRPQAHACFIQSVRDDLVGTDGIFDLWIREARLFKHGAGSGTNFSSLRGKGEPLAAGGKSSGLISFLRVGDASASAIESGGTTRRAAKMVIVDLDHPDVREFIRWKAREEEKVALLLVGSEELQRLWPQLSSASPETLNGLALESGFPLAFLRKLAGLSQTAWQVLPALDADWRGEAYRTVSGQNSNNSVRVPDAFFRALDADESWILRHRTDPRRGEELPARALWEEIGLAAWACADPGLQFADTINSWHTCRASGEIRASNPCAEYLFLDDTGCNLASINVLKFLSAEGKFDTEGFEHTVRLWTLALEITVAMAQFPTEAIARNTHRYRTLGIGYANIGSLLMVLGLPYASDEARRLLGALTSAMTATAYRTSAEMASEKGPFVGYAKNQTPMGEVIERHSTASSALKWEGNTSAPAAAIFTSLKELADRAWKTATEEGKKHGFRNAQTTAIAPTGTIGLVMDCDTLGIEPEYAFAKNKALAGGGSMALRNASLERALKGLGYSAQSIEHIESQLTSSVLASQVIGLKPEHRAVFHCSEEIAANDHLAMVAAVQSFVSGGISKTVNLPEIARPQEILDCYRKAWALGIKCISVYRRGSKLSQPWSGPADDCAVCS